jgi:DNA repair photolyase
VNVPAIQQPIQPSPGFAKKRLSDFKLDIMALCQFGCRYCSSNSGNYLRINRNRLAIATKAQLGKVYLPANDPGLTIQWHDVLEKLESQLAEAPKDWDTGKTLVFSMLTDGFSPIAVRSGLTENILRLVLDRTRFRIRVLTKNAIVGQERWLRFFEEHRDRFVVGLSIGTLDDAWSRRVEMFTSPPTRRLAALRGLQDAGVPSYGMLCPVFPDVLQDDAIERLIDAVRPHVVEHVWAEPFNSRNNWKHVRRGYPTDSFGWSWFTDVYENRRLERWSTYATQLYLRLRDKARAEGWIGKLRYLLYESKITQVDAERFSGLQGVLLQSKPAEDGKSTNPNLARYQR